MGACASSEPANSKELVSILTDTPFIFRLGQTELEKFAHYFVLRRYPKNKVISNVDSPPEFFVIGDGWVDIIYDGFPVASKGRGDFFGQIHVNSAINLERKESLLGRVPHSPGGADSFKPKNLGTVPLTKRESQIDALRLASVSAVTEVTVAVLTRDKLTAFLAASDEITKEIITSTMGATTTKNLETLPFLAGISPRRIEVLSSMLHYVPLKEGAVLFEEGSLGTQMFIVYQGTLKAVAKVRDEGKETHKEVILNSFKEGDFFGEISLIMGMPRTAAIVATSPALLLELRKDDFQNFLKLTPNAPFYDLMKRRFANHFKKYKVPFFSAIPDDKYPLLASLCKVEQIIPNTIIFKEGDVGSTFYIIAHGEVVVTSQRRKSKFKGNPNGSDEIELCTMGPGKYFGEIALIRDTKRTATVRTKTRCVVLSITRDNFEKFFQECPEALADFEVKLARYDVSLRSVIYHPLGLDYFTRFLMREYSAENIRFWRAAREYRHVGQTHTFNAQNSLPLSSTIPQGLSEIYKGTAPLPDEHREKNIHDEDSDDEQPLSGRVHSMSRSSISMNAINVGINDRAVFDVEPDPTRSVKEQLLDAAKKIVRQFITQDSEEQVNIHGDTRVYIEKKVISGDVDNTLFVAAEKEILALLERDSFSRFKQSDLFREFLSDAESYDEKMQHDAIKNSNARDPRLRSGSVVVSVARPTSSIIQSLSPRDEASKHTPYLPLPEDSSPVDSQPTRRRSVEDMTDVTMEADFMPLKK